MTHTNKVEGWVKVPGLSNVQRIWTCDTSTCAWLTDGQLKCFGLFLHNVFPGQDGLHTEDRVATPTELGLPGVMELDEAWYNLLCARLEDGRIVCNTSDAPTPEAFPGGWRTLPAAEP